jgi:hypothetical protein
MRKPHTSAGLAGLARCQSDLTDTEQLFPVSRPSADQFVFVIEADGEQVGELWLAERESGWGRALGL